MRAAYFLAAVWGTDLSRAFTVEGSWKMTVGTVLVGGKTMAEFNSTGGSNESFYAFAISDGETMASAGPAFLCQPPYNVLQRVKNVKSLKGGSSAVLSRADGTCKSTNGIVSMSFRRQIALGGIETKPINENADTQFIWASGPGEFKRHKKRGGGSFNIATGGGSSGSSTRTLIYIHTGLLGAAWVLLAPLGIMMARYFKAYNPLWFHLHRVFVLLAIVFTLVGVIIGFTEGDHTSSHMWLGIVIISILTLQPIVAVLRPDKEASSRKAWYLTHAFIGLLLVVLTVVQVTLGITLLDDSVRVPSIGAVAAVYGVQFLFAIISELGKQGFVPLPYMNKNE